MRIAIDARLGYYIQGGIPQYTLNLIHALAAVDQENDYLVFQRRADHIYNPNIMFLFHRLLTLYPSLGVSFLFKPLRNHVDLIIG